MIPAAELTQRVEILTRSVSEDSFGQEVEAWGEPVKRWVKVEYGSAASRRISSQERRIAGQEIASTTATFTLRFDPFTRTITELNHRLRFDGVEWDIESVIAEIRGDVSITARRGSRS